jgi:hypothetical protein
VTLLEKGAEDKNKEGQGASYCLPNITGMVVQKRVWYTRM